MTSIGIDGGCQVEQPDTAKLFMNGRSQAVRLPAKYRFKGTEVYVSREGDKIVLSAKPASWDDFFDAEPRVPPDFMRDRADELPQRRRSLR
jgi:antitoxin VapB